MFLKFTIFIGFILSIGAALGSFSIYSSYQVERELRLDAESRLLQVQQSEDAAEQTAAEDQAKLERLQAEVDDVNLRLEAKTDLVTQLEAELADKELEIESLKETISEIEKLPAMPAVEQPVEEAQAAAESIETGTQDFMSATESPAAAPAPVMPAQPAAESMITPASQAAPAVSAAPVSSSSAQSSANEPAGDFRILTVNRKFNFIVINQGLKDGLRMGDKIEVFQGSTQKALAQVEKIYDKFSAATLLSEDEGNPVHEGDTVRKA